MPANRISMRKLHDVFRLSFQAKLRYRKMGRCLGPSHTTICNYLRRAAQAGLTWPLPEDVTDAVLEKTLFVQVTSDQRPWPDWAKIHEELKGVTLRLLWQ